MKAALYRGAHDIVVTEIETPACGPRDVLVRNLAAGICGSDVAVFQHGSTAHLIDAGTEFGHEMISEVAEIGNEVTDFSVGQRVYPYPLLAKGDPLRAGSLGAFSEFILVPNARTGHELYPIDDAIPTPLAALIEPFTVAHNAVRRAVPQPGERALVIGTGTIGIGAAIALRAAGVADVLVADVSDLRLEKAAGLGFAVVNNRQEDLTERAKAHFGERVSLLGSSVDADIIVIAAPDESLVAPVQAMAKPGARIVAVAVFDNPVAIDFVKLCYGQQTLIGPGAYGPEDVTGVLQILAAGVPGLESIITHSFGLDQIVDAIELAGRPDVAFHVAITY
jgi:2-desacetyl-2-hydroxyethyl bacteriochlorophyllide A dehydrogenase